MIESRLQLPLEPIFSGDSDWQNNACMNWSHSAMEIYIIGYKEAADSLAEKVINEGRHQDSLVYPICFMYRQYIELRLKEIIKSGQQLIGDEGNFHQHHNIKDLWIQAIAIIKKVFADYPDPPELSLANHIIEQFSSIDPRSLSFRYPTNKDGQSTLPGVKYINIRRVAEYVGEFSEFVEGCSAGISELLEYKNQ